MKVLPYLTFGDIDSMHCLLDHFVPYLEFDKFDTDHSTETSLYLDCFTAVSNGIGVSCVSCRVVCGGSEGSVWEGSEGSVWEGSEGSVWEGSEDSVWMGVTCWIVLPYLFFLFFLRLMLVGPN